MGKSPKNTKPESLDVEAPEGENLPAVFTRAGEVTVVDLQVDALQRRLEQSEDQRKEERFLWFMVCGLLMVSLIFNAAGTAAGGFASLIYVAMALVLSRRWGFEDLWSSLHAAKELIGFKPKAGEDD